MRYFTTFYCERCSQVRRFTKRGPEAHRHWLATILTCGLWAIPWWIIRRREAARPWRCCVCKTLQAPQSEPQEARMLREQRKSGPMPVIAPRREFRAG